MDPSMDGNHAQKHPNNGPHDHEHNPQAQRSHSVLQTQSTFLGQTLPDDLGDKSRMCVRKGIFVRWLEDELNAEQSCLELPLTIILVVSFTVLASLHVQSHKIYGVEEAIEFDIEENANFAFSEFFGHKNLNDVNSIADFWSWVRLGFMPLLLTSKNGYVYSESLTPDVAGSSSYNVSRLGDGGVEHSGYNKKLPLQGDYLHHNRIIGGIRFRQEVGTASIDNCVYPSGISPDEFSQWLGKPCTSASSRPFDLPPEYHHAESYAREKPAREEWFWLEDSFDSTLQKLVDMEDGCEQLAEKNRVCLCQWCAQQKPPQPWIDELTERIEISIAIFNPHYGLFLVIGVNFFLNRGGHIYKLIHVQSSWASPLHTDQPFTMYLMLAMDAIWVLSLAYIFVKEIIEVGRVIQNHGFAGIWSKYMDIWNAVDWFSIGVACLMVSNFFNLLMISSTAADAFSDVVSGDSSPQAVQHVYEMLEQQVRTDRNLRLTLMVYPVVVVLRLFKAFSAQPRLAVVTNTLASAGQDMLHFFIVFACIFVSFTSYGCLLFGQDLVDFSTFNRSFFTCFRAMLGDFDWDDFETVGRTYAAIWFILFMVTVNILLLNMLLAIIMDAYSEVKSRAANAQTIVQQIELITRRRTERKAGLRVSLFDVQKAFAEQDPDPESRYSSKDLLYTSSLIKVVLQFAQKTMPQHQAEHVIESAKVYGTSKFPDESAEADEECPPPPGPSSAQAGDGGGDYPKLATASNGECSKAIISPDIEELGGRLRCLEAGQELQQEALGRLEDMQKQMLSRMLASVEQLQLDMRTQLQNSVSSQQQMLSENLSKRQTRGVEMVHNRSGTYLTSKGCCMPDAPALSVPASARAVAKQ